MNDSPVASSDAPAAAANTPAPASPAHQGEVPIDTNRVQLPDPVGSQAPDRPTGHSRMEAIQAAFERAQRPPTPPKKTAPAAPPKAAEATPGHNRPPADTPADRPTVPLNLKKRPDDQEPQPRGDRGQWAPRTPRPEPAAPAESGQPVPTAAKPGQPVRELPANAPFREPLPRMSQQAAADWAATPETVRGDIHRIAGEFSRAYQAYRGDHEAMEPIRRFQQLATQQGTTLEQALSHFVSMEHKLRTDLVGGLDLIVNNLGLKTADGQRITLRDVAYHILTQSPEQIRQTQQGNVQQSTSLQLGSLMQEIAGLKNSINQLHTQHKFTYTRSAVDKFAETHPRLDELGSAVEREIKLGFDLETAYRRADLLNPAPHAEQIRDTSAQTRHSDRSISGAPAGANGAARPPAKSPSRREAIANAIKTVGGSL